MTMRTIFLASSLILTVAAGCATAPSSQAKKDELKSECANALARMKSEDPGLQKFLDQSHAYVIFPCVGKGAWFVGGAYGRGEVYQDGKMIGYADISQASIGLQWGGQQYSELIAFENKDALNQFTSGTLAFAGNASAVALKSGAAAAADYNHGVAVFTSPVGGLMVEASIGGQQFTYVPLSSTRPTAQASTSE